MTNKIVSCRCTNSTWNYLRVKTLSDYLWFCFIVHVDVICNQKWIMIAISLVFSLVPLFVVCVFLCAFSVLWQQHNGVGNNTKPIEYKCWYRPFFGGFAYKFWIELRLVTRARQTVLKKIPWWFFRLARFNKKNRIYFPKVTLFETKLVYNTKLVIIIL